jgi:hypothetical protein
MCLSKFGAAEAGRYFPDLATRALWQSIADA